jgi:SAM-dependent methyltransferase
MRILDLLHERSVLPRRVHRLSILLSDLIPADCYVLDVGCGDGRIDSLLLQKRPDLSIQGVDVLVRDQTEIRVTQFDGTHLPFPDGSFDTVMFIDVLHHTVDPMALMREAVRVSRCCLVIKDHFLQGFLPGVRLRFMDYVGNARYHVALPYNYWTPEKWEHARQLAGLNKSVEIRELGLYPMPADFVFGAGLHFIARFDLPQNRVPLMS